LWEAVFSVGVHPEAISGESKHKPVRMTDTPQTIGVNLALFADDTYARRATFSENSNMA
jgi:hypothetical protein